MANNHSSSLTPYTRPPETSDPYPERTNRLGGVRQHTPPQQPQLRELHTRPIARPPSPVAAAFHPPQPVQVPTRRFPIASVGIYALGQVLLAYAIAVGTVQPGVGVLVCVLWMLCGLALICAQHRSDIGDDRR